jgi:tRNA threonylcarbamoyladenosine biosynthesis protein TsaE
MNTLKRRWVTLLVTVAWICTLSVVTPVRAHPHMWIDAQVQFGFNAEGQVTGITQTWVFDEMFSSYAKQGLPLLDNGSPDPAELAKIGQTWIEALADPMSHYFTTIRWRGQDVPVGPAQRVRVHWDNATEQMSLTFELPLLEELTLKDQALTVSIADPTFYVAYSFDQPDAINLLAAPSYCQATYQPPRPLDRQTAQRLAAIPADVAELPDDLMAITQTLQHRVVLSCP